MAGRRYVLVNTDREGRVVYWMGGAPKSTGSMVQPVETVHRHLAARLTAIEAEDALDRQLRAMRDQGWVVTNE